MSVKDLLSQVRRPERAVELCLRGDLVAKFEEAERRLDRARLEDSDTFAGGGGARKIAAEVKAIEAEMNAALTTFRMRSLQRMRPMEVLAEHPPRDGNDQDKALGYNPDTYYAAMVRESTYEIVGADGEVLPAEELDLEGWDALLDAVSYKQFDDLVSAAITLNDRDVAVPFSHLASLISQENEGDSKQPSNGASRPSGSRPGNPKKRRSTSTKTTPTTTPEPSSDGAAAFGL